MKAFIRIFAGCSLMFLLLTGMARADMAGMDHAMPGMNAAPAGVSHETADSEVKAFSYGGSGTAWLPADDPMLATMGNWGEWMWMAHGNLFLRYDAQNVGNRGQRGSADAWDAPNWIMAMAERSTGQDSLVLFKLMLSLDPLTIGGQGYPLLFQSGETWQGKPLVDRQHPHDLVSELAALYQQRVGAACSVFIYLGYPGEPALGPPAFMHRLSALPDPDAPLGHHWQDSTHVTFGVSTLGVVYRDLKIEGSAFNGREPDENRYAFDPVHLDSFSGRVSYNPGSAWSLQASYGFLHSPEALRPEESIHRLTASAIHQLALGKRDYLATSLVGGVNYAADGSAEPSLLFESALRWGAIQPYLRAEVVEKSREELELDPAQFAPGHYEAKTITLGASCDVAQGVGLTAALGGQVELFFLSPALEPLYGANPYSLEIYLRIFPRGSESAN